MFYFIHLNPLSGPQGDASPLKYIKSSGKLHNLPKWYWNWDLNLVLLGSKTVFFSCYFKLILVTFCTFCCCDRHGDSDINLYVHCGIIIRLEIFVEWMKKGFYVRKNYWQVCGINLLNWRMDRFHPVLSNYWIFYSNWGRLC